MTVADVALVLTHACRGRGERLWRVANALDRCGLGTAPCGRQLPLPPWGDGDPEAWAKALILEVEAKAAAKDARRAVSLSGKHECVPVHFVGSAVPAFWCKHCRRWLSADEKDAACPARRTAKDSADSA